MQLDVLLYLKISAASCFLPIASATCTNWTKVPSPTCPDCLSGYSIPIDIIECPQPNNDSSCTIPAKIYQVEARHHIDIPNPLQLNISILKSDAESIYDFAQETPFIPYDSINATVNTLDMQREDRKMTLGTKKELSFVPFMNAASGKPSGCQNTTLNGLVLMVLAPAYKGFPGDDLAGMWVVVTKNISDDTGSAMSSKEKTSAGRLGASRMWGAATGLGLSAILFSFL